MMMLPGMPIEFKKSYNRGISGGGTFYLASISEPSSSVFLSFLAGSFEFKKDYNRECSYSELLNWRPETSFL